MQILFATFDGNLVNRLSAVLDGDVIVNRVDPDAFSLRDAVQWITPDVLMFDADTAPEAGDDFLAATRALTESSAHCHVVAIGDEANSTVVLTAMRAGARDFLDRTIKDTELKNKFALYRDHIRERIARRPDSDQARLTLIASGRPGDGSELFAINHACLRAKAGGDVLLIDLSFGVSEAATALDVTINYTLSNVVNDMARLDRTLLFAALAQHEESGLYVLPLNASNSDRQEVAPNDLLPMIATLRGMFSEVILHASAMRTNVLFSDFLREANVFYLIATQRLTAVRACLDMLSRHDPAAQLRNHITLVVDEYQREISLSDQQMARTLGLRHAVRVPYARAALLDSLNKGVPLVIEEATGAYARAMRALVPQSPIKKDSAPAAGGLLRRLLHLPAAAAL